MECPSLDAVLHAMEAQKSAGWFSPHMKTVMELKAALGSKDALMQALHESRYTYLHFQIQYFIVNKISACIYNRIE